ncbi:MAG: hypothetical protein NC299_07635 [Lachnospiraceae bacterium]|nr:hypothetical protein [Ruminococcus sp.]MCM1275225.1 hypothetical protein [Lachnospiraceae bacterium]
MKNYEEMASSVLKRRDAEIKRRRRAFLIGAPCAAAVLVGVVGIGSAVAANYRNNVPIIAPPNDAENTSTAEIANAVTVDASAEVADVPAIDIAVEPYVPDYTNPNSGDTDDVMPIHYITAAEELQTIAPDLNEEDFTPYTLEGLDSFYGLRFNRLAEIYPDWQYTCDKLGLYRHEESDGFISSMTMVSTLNTITYTAPSGGIVKVSAQYGRFDMPLFGDLPAYPENDAPAAAYEPEVNYEYDEDGNVIGASIGGYDPTANAEAPSNPDTNPDTDLPLPLYRVNGYDAFVTAVLDSSSNVDHYTAYIPMNSYVRITAYNVDQFEFAEILDNFTK